MSRTIKAILPPKKPATKATVIFDDGTTKKLLPNVAADFALVPGLELSDHEFAELEKANSAASAKQRAVRIISAASVSKRDLERRLTQKGESEADARSAVRWLEDLKLLDDAETARQIVARGAVRGYGAERIKQMLWEKRIPKKYWDEALETLPDMREALETFLRTRLGEEPDEKTLRSATQAAARRGYTWTEIHEALERIQKI